MSYLLDKKIKRKKFFKIAISVAVLVILFYFRSGIWNGLSYASLTLFRPILITGNNIGEKFESISSYFAYKNSLYLQNKKLQSQLSLDRARMSNYDSVVSENISLKEILGRKSEKSAVVLAAILSKPNQSIYNTLIIDIGLEQGVKIGDTVFALGNIPIGRIAEISPNSSKVILFSSPGEKTRAILSGEDIFIEVVGRGGGNFEMTMPRDFILQKGDQVVLPGINPLLVAVVETIISDLRNPSTRVLLSSPVNIQELKFVEVRI